MVKMNSFHAEVFAVGQKAVHSQEPPAHFSSPCPHSKRKVFPWTGRVQEGAWLPLETMERKLSALKQSLHANALLGWSGSSPVLQFDSAVLSAVKLLCFSHLRHSNHEYFSGGKVSQLQPVWKTNDSPSPGPALSSLWVWRSAMIVFYLISFHFPAPPYCPQAVWRSLWKENLVWKGRRPCLWDARISGVSWEGTVLGHSVGACTGHEEGLQWCHLCPCERWAVLPMYDMDLIQKLPWQILLDLLGVWNQTRWSFLALKFSYSKILPHFLSSLSERSISSQSPDASFFFSPRDPLFFFFPEKIQRSFFCSEVYFFLLLALWAVRKESVCLKSCSHWLQHKLFWVPCDNGSQLFFWISVSIYKPETFCLCLLLPPPF